MNKSDVVLGLESAEYYFRRMTAVCPKEHKHYYEPKEQAIKEAIALLKEQELGHWIFLTDCSNSGVYCSECNTKVFDSYPFKKRLAYFCPHCGTRMEGEIERR